MNNLLFPHSFDPSPEEISEGCKGEIHPSAVKGIELFNQRKYWHSHEALEEAWLEEKGTVRALYKGILQAGTIYLQIERNNLRGVMKMYKRCKVWLWPWPDVCHGIKVGQLKSDVETAYETAVKLGEGNLVQFDDKLYKTIEYVN